MQLSLIVKLGAGIWTPLTTLFGWLTSLLYDFFGSYGLAIIFMTVIVRGLTVPLNVRSQKAMMKQQTLSDKQAEIKRKYPDDKQKQEEELQKLFKENGASTLSGCILPFLPILFFFPIFYIVRCPLQYITGVSESNIKEMGKLLGIKGAADNNIAIINRLREDSAAMTQVVNKGLIKMEQVLDMKFLGLDLGKKPQFLPNRIMANPKVYVPLLIVPLLVLVTTILQNILISATKPDAKKKKEEKKRAKLNPANNQPDDPTARTTKIMNIIMPVIMVVTTFTMPAAFGFYWIVGNIMGMIQQVLTYFMFSKPFEEKKREMEEMKKNAFKKKKLALETAGNGGKKKK